MPEAYFEDSESGIVLYHGDVRDLLPSIESSSVSLWLTDPPYHRVKDQWWDRQWSDDAAFLAFIAGITDEAARTLSGNGSLYMFASPRMSARVEVAVSERMHVLNNIVWYKQGQHRGAQAETGALRSYWDGSERVVFAEQYGADSHAMAGSGYNAKCDELRGFVFEPLRAYLASEWRRAGLKFAEANEACGTASMAGSHYFTRSQWCLPTEAHYTSLQAYANRFRNGPGPEYLRREYEDLRREYEDLRRPFRATRRHQWDDVWTFAPVQSYEGKHPCEKPLAMLQQIVEVSSRPGDVVFDGFMGKGRLAELCKATGRRGIFCEIEERWCEDAAQRLEAFFPLFTEPTPPPVQTTLEL